MNVTEKNIPMIHAALATTRDYLQTHRDPTQRFLRAYLEGISIALTDAEFTKQMIGKYTKTDRSERSGEFLPSIFACLGTAPLGPGCGRTDNA